MAATLTALPAAATGRLVPADYPTIRAAINAAADGDSVIVSAGTYVERINFGGKAIIVISTDPGSPAVVAATIINGNAGVVVVTFDSGETELSVLAGFTITNGTGGIYCLNSSPTISGNVIPGNTALDGGGIDCVRTGASCSPTISATRSVSTSRGTVVAESSPTGPPR